MELGELKQEARNIARDVHVMSTAKQQQQEKGDCCSRTFNGQWYGMHRHFWTVSDVYDHGDGYLECRMKRSAE